MVVVTGRGGPENDDRRSTVASNLSHSHFSAFLFATATWQLLTEHRCTLSGSQCLLSSHRLDTSSQIIRHENTKLRSMLHIREQLVSIFGLMMMQTRRRNIIGSYSC